MRIDIRNSLIVFVKIKNFNKQFFLQNIKLSKQQLTLEQQGNIH